MPTNGRATFSVALCLGSLVLAPRAANAQVTGDTGLGQPFTTMQPSLAMNYLISTTGIFPSHDSAPNGKFLGEVTPFAGNFAPGGWAVANGQLLSISQNTALFSLLGTTYGGDGITTFALPDLRGRTVINTGQGPGLSNQFEGSPTGVSQITMNVNQLPAHDHTLPGGGVTGNTGGNQPFTNMQPSLPLSYFINDVGIFPSQGGAGPTDMPFLGALDLFAGNFSFGGAPNASGQLLPINQNTALFSILGTTYGGNGVTNFALPDLRGRTAIGAGQGPGLSNRNLGDQLGQETTTLTVSQLPPHVHTLPGGGVTGVTGGGQPVNNMQPSLTLHYIIATNGSFPLRDTDNPTEPLIGQMSLFAGNFAPSGWQFADGQLLSIAQNTALFSILGTTFGGNGLNDFALPDLRGRTIIGAGQGPGLPNFDLGEITGTESYSLTIAQMADHDHAIPVPEPASVLLAFAGAAGLLLISRGRRRKS
jgi:microcystin-dependent protein